MNHKIVALLIFCGFVSSGNCMKSREFEKKCDRAERNHVRKERARAEKERLENADIEGCESLTLAEAGFGLRAKDQSNKFVCDYFNQIEVYKLEDGNYLIDLHVHSYSLVKDFVAKRIERSDNFCEVLCDIGFYGLFEGVYIDTFSQILRNCPINHTTKKFTTDNLLQGTNLIIDPGIRHSEPSMLSKIGYGAIGFALAMPVCYALYLKFGE